MSQFDSGRRVNSEPASRWWPPLALGLVLLGNSGAVWASGVGSSSTSAMFPGISDADGVYFNTYGPNPTVSAGVRSLTHTRVYLNRAAYYLNGVGFFTFDAQSNRRLAYQISDANGNFTYYLTSPVYAPGTLVSAANWRNSGTNWHFNWWGPDFNVGVDATNLAGDRLVEEASVGADGWGGCENSYPSNTAWSWIYRNRFNGSWFYFPAAQNFNWGNTPTWWITGDIINNGSISFGTSSCP